MLKKLATAAPTHRRLFVLELAEWARNLSGPAVEELDRLGDAETVAVSTTSMAGAAILRVLQALSALTSGIGSSSEQDAGGEEKDQEDLLLVRDLNGGLEILWQGLSACVGKIESRLGNSSALGAPSSSAAPSAAAAAAVVGPGLVASHLLCHQALRSYYLLWRHSSYCVRSSRLAPLSLGRTSRTVRQQVRSRKQKHLIRQT